MKIGFRWYFINGHGSMFGGAMLAATDPIPALQLSRIFPKMVVWSKAHDIVFKKPALSKLTTQVMLEDYRLQQIGEILRKEGKYVGSFHYPLYDVKGDIVAEVRSTVYLRNPRHSTFLQSASAEAK